MFGGVVAKPAGRMTTTPVPPVAGAESAVAPPAAPAPAGVREAGRPGGGGVGVAGVGAVLADLKSRPSPARAGGANSAPSAKMMPIADAAARRPTALRPAALRP